MGIFIETMLNRHFLAILATKRRTNTIAIATRSLDHSSLNKIGKGPEFTGGTGSYCNRKIAGIT